MYVGHSASPTEDVQLDYPPPEDFPRVMFYGGQGLLSDGTPLVNSASTVDSTVADAFARYGTMCFQPASLIDTYYFALEELLERNPNMKFWMQLMTDDCIPTVTSAYQTEYVSIVGDQVWPLTSGSKRHPQLTNDALRQELAEFWAGHLNNGIFTGALIDILGGFPGESEGIDWAAAGFASEDAFQQEHQAAANELIAELRALCPSTILLGNYGPGVTDTIYTNRELIQGWARENFPNQNPTGWDANVWNSSVTDWAMVDDDDRYGRPPYGLIFTPIVTDSLSVANEKLMRFHLGTTCLAFHYYSWGPTNFVYGVAGWSGISAPNNEGNGVDTWAEHWGNWGYIKEFGIDRETGAQTGVCNGWLGQPIDDYVRYDAGANDLWYREFQYGTVIVNPSFAFPVDITLPGSPTRYELLTHATTTWPRSVPASDAVFLLK